MRIASLKSWLLFAYVTGVFVAADSIILRPEVNSSTESESALGNITQKLLAVTEISALRQLHPQSPFLKIEQNNSTEPVNVVSKSFPSESYTSEPTSPSSGTKYFNGVLRSRRPRIRAKPFGVKIEDVNFYGGLIIYSHELHTSKICRVLNACVRPDGTLVLPAWMRRLDDSLSFHCGQTKLEFSLPDTNEPPPLIAKDLIGMINPRPSMPDFLQDFIPNAVVFDLIYGDHDVSKSCHSRKGRDCGPFPALAQEFRPLLQLDRRLKSLEEKQSWVRQFVQLMKPLKPGTQPSIAYSLFPDSASESSLKCFRSTLFTRGPYSKKLITDEHLRNIHFLRQNSIERAPRDVFLNSTSEREDGMKSCEIAITISNRKLIDGAHNRLIGRYIMNIPALREAIYTQVKRVPGLHINISTLTMEGRSLRWQINAMQKTDIWVAGHGSLLTNMIFLRENSTVIEIQPFAYYPKRFEFMAQNLAHVNYDRYIAHPDMQAFKACIRQLYPPSHGAHFEAVALLDKFRSAAEKYRQSDNTHAVTLQNLKDERLRQVQTCALMQRLDTSERNFAIAIVRHARLRCNYPRPNLSDSKTKSN